MLEFSSVLCVIEHGKDKKGRAESHSGEQHRAECGCVDKHGDIK